MTYNNFLNLLKKRGLTPIESVGRFFDPHLHEIVATKEVEGAGKPVVLDEVQRGYMLEDKVLRPSKVIVGIQKQAEDKKANPEEHEAGEENKEIE
jgi:molecular chaperone GrpE